MHAWKWFLRKMSPNGRSTRREYTIVLILLGMTAMLGAIFFEPNSADLMEYYPIQSWAFIAWMIAILWAQTMTTVRRLHDTGVSGWWYLVMHVIPVVGEFGFILLIFMPPGSFNKEGAQRWIDPRIKINAGQ
jgi:uncharacterized membrane protein YhaH (DUF805 family)